MKNIQYCVDKERQTNVDSCTVSVTGALSSLQHPDPLKADMLLPSLLHTAVIFENVKKRVKRKVGRPSGSARVCLVRASQIQTLNLPLNHTWIRFLESHLKRAG